MTRRLLSLLASVFACQACQQDPPIKSGDSLLSLAPIIVVVDDRSGTVKREGITSPDTAFYATLARDMQQNCPGGMLSVVLCGNPQPASKASLRFEADTVRLRHPGEEANHRDRYFARLHNEKTEALRGKRLADFLGLIDQRFIHYVPSDNKDLTFLDDALLRARRILEVPVYAGRPKLVILISDGKNEDSQGNVIPLSHPFVSEGDSWEIVLDNWIDPGAAQFGNAEVQNVESLQDVLRIARQFLEKNSSAR